MNHLLKQWKKDWGQFRWFLVGLWLLLLACIGASKRGLIPTRLPSQPVGVPEFTSLSYEIAFALALALAVGIFASDSLTSRTSFWRTRPWQRQTVGAAKFSFVALFLLLPCVVAPLVTAWLFKPTANWFYPVVLQQCKNALPWLWVPFLATACSCRWTKILPASVVTSLLIYAVQHVLFPTEQMMNAEWTLDPALARRALESVTLVQCRKLIVELVLILSLPLVVIAFYRNSGRGVGAWKWPLLTLTVAIALGCFWKYDWLNPRLLARNHLTEVQMQADDRHRNFVNLPISQLATVRDIRGIPDSMRSAPTTPTSSNDEASKRFSATPLGEIDKYGLLDFSNSGDAAEPLKDILLGKTGNFTRFPSGRHRRWQREGEPLPVKAEVLFYDLRLRARIPFPELARGEVIYRDGVAFRAERRGLICFFFSSAISSDSPWGCDGIPQDTTSLALWNPVTQELRFPWRDEFERDREPNNLVTTAGGIRYINNGFVIARGNDDQDLRILKELDQYELVLFQYAYLGWQELPMRW